LFQSLARMRATLESTIDAILVTNGKVKVIDFNEKCIGMSKIPREVRSQARPGSAYVSLTALKPTSDVGMRRSNQLLGIQILVPVEDSEGRLVGVLVANVMTRQLLWLLQDLKRQATGDESPCLLDKAGLVLMTRCFVSVNVFIRTCREEDTGARLVKQGPSRPIVVVLRPRRR
jgi:hypothetical protein